MGDNVNEGMKSVQDEVQFRQRVENVPLIINLKHGQEQIQKTLNEEIESNSRRFSNLEDKVEKLEEKVDKGFNSITKAVTDLTNEIKDEKITKLNKKLDQKDTFKNSLLIILVGAVVTLAGKLGYDYLTAIAEVIK